MNIPRLFRHPAPSVRLLPALIVGLLLLVGASAMASAAPALWKVQAGPRTLYLFGTIHVLKGTEKWFRGRLKASFDEADEIVLELSPTDMAAPETVALIRRYGLDTGDGGDGLSLNATERQSVAALAGRYNLREKIIYRMRPWYLSVFLSVRVAQHFGFEPEFGAEQRLIAAAKRAGKPVSGLERPRDQLEPLWRMKPAAQHRLLKVTVAQLKDAGDMLDELNRAWLNGDMATLDKALLAPLEDDPELARALFATRNRHWLDKFRAMLKGGPKTRFIAVGAGHFLDSDGLISLLRQSALEVVRVQ